jgi:hypothetical protein
MAGWRQQERIARAATVRRMAASACCCSALCGRGVRGETGSGGGGGWRATAQVGLQSNKSSTLGRQIDHAPIVLWSMTMTCHGRRGTCHRSVSKKKYWLYTGTLQNQEYKIRTDSWTQALEPFVSHMSGTVIKQPRPTTYNLIQKALQTSRIGSTAVNDQTVS